MYQMLLKNIEKRKFIYAFSFILLSLLIFTFFNKNTNSIKNLSNNKIPFSRETELNLIRDFLFKQIKSPFEDIKHGIKKGDSIGKILKKYNVENAQIQEVIKQYKIYGKANQLLVGNTIDLTIEKNIISGGNSIIKFFIPITKVQVLKLKRMNLENSNQKKLLLSFIKKRL